ncbi:MAG: hypothetical protein ABSG53_24120 [Thermoguttaceae bacterium]|jgi:hypothetical protein
MPTAIDSTDLTILQEYADNRGVLLRVDRQLGVIPGVKLLGAVSRKGREYPKEVMARALPLYEGMRVNIDHVDPGQRRSLRDRIGLVKNVTLKEDGLYGDFHFNPKHALAEQIAWDAENAPQNLGFSHDTRGASTNRGGKVVVESIDQVLSVDLVANPATTTGLFESTDTFSTQEEKNMDLSKLTIQELRESRDDLVKVILTEADEGHAEGARIKDLEAKITTLQETIDGYKAADAKRALQEAIAGELKAAGLDPQNKTQCSEIFLEDLHGCADPTKRKAKIDDRKQLAGTSKPAADHRCSPAPFTPAPFQESTDGPAILPPTAPLSERLRRFAR